jgi:hypothetical protein
VGRKTLAIVRLIGEYVLDTLADGRELAQALADQRGWTW